jgi:hypothetical protein
MALILDAIASAVEVAEGLAMGVGEDSRVAEGIGTAVDTAASGGVVQAARSREAIAPATEQMTRILVP